jgi:hypothetical protein
MGSIVRYMWALFMRSSGLNGLEMLEFSMTGKFHLFQGSQSLV